MISSFRSAFGGSGLFTNVMWTGHRISSTATNGTTNYNRSCSYEKYIFMLERSDPSKPTIREINSKGVLMHELSHQYGARDHYHELADLSDLSSCKFKEICSECGTNPRPENCIMCNPRIDITNPGTICSACIEDILVYLRSQSGR